MPVVEQGTRATAAAPSPQRVARVSISPASAEVHEGETLRLSASIFDASGQALVGRDMTWVSRRPEVATIDASGLVTARSTGATELTAASEGETASVILTVLAKAPAAPPSVDVGQLARGRIDDFLNALGARDAGRVTALYSAQTGPDQQNLAWLQDKLRRAEARLSVTEPHVGATQSGDGESTTDFTARLRWTTPFGRERSVAAQFRARVVRTGDAWRFAGIRVIGSLE